MEDWEKEFVTYDLASRMKALGFTESCFNLYHLNRRELMYVCPNIGEVATYKYDNHNKTNHISAPTWQSAFRWFKKEYKIHVSYGTTSDYHEERNGFVISNYIDGSRNNLFTDWEVGTYEEAELACLTKLIEIVESK
jgi:hypothetical protein